MSGPCLTQTEIHHCDIAKQVLLDVIVVTLF